MAPTVPSFAAASPPPGQLRAGSRFADMAMGALPALPAMAQRAPAVTARARPQTALATAQRVTVGPVLAATKPAQTAVIRAQPVASASAVARSLRPMARPRDLRPALGGAERRTRQGADAQTGDRARQGEGRTPDAAALAAARQAAATYDNRVMAQISRVRRARTQLRGTAFVRFRIAGDGSLASVGIARTSGHAQLDQIAIAHVRKAAPYPTPPVGARRSFIVEFRGR